MFGDTAINSNFLGNNENCGTGNRKFPPMFRLLPYPEFREFVDKLNKSAHIIAVASMFLEPRVTRESNGYILKFEF